MDKDIETMTTQGLERAADELLAADAMKPAPKKKEHAPHQGRRGRACRGNSRD